SRLNPANPGSVLAEQQLPDECRRALAFIPPRGNVRIMQESALQSVVVINAARACEQAALVRQVQAGGAYADLYTYLHAHAGVDSEQALAGNFRARDRLVVEDQLHEANVAQEQARMDQSSHSLARMQVALDHIEALRARDLAAENGQHEE